MPIANILQPLIDVANGVLSFFHDNVGVSWGMAIILLTVCTRAVLIPLTYRQLKSMRALQAFQPQMKELQEKYKNDRQRLSQEMMKFYQENKINPLASCIPLIAQLPVFITLFQALKGPLREDICGQTQMTCGSIPTSVVNDSTQSTISHNLQTMTNLGQSEIANITSHFSSIAPKIPFGESFLFIPDLTAKATGGVLITLIILYVGTQLVSGLVSATTGDRNQRMLMMALPVVFVPFIIGFPAGLILYWITTNFWTIGQTYVINRVIPPPAMATPEGAVAAASTKPPPPPPKKKKRKR